MAHFPAISLHFFRDFPAILYRELQISSIAKILLRKKCTQNRAISATSLLHLFPRFSIAICSFHSKKHAPKRVNQPPVEIFDILKNLAHFFERKTRGKSRLLEKVGVALRVRYRAKCVDTFCAFLLHIFRDFRAILYRDLLQSSSLTAPRQHRSSSRAAPEQLQNSA